MTKTKIKDVRNADPFHNVVSIESNKLIYRRQPCDTCPWRKDAVGEFPAKAFRISAPTAYDMAEETFGCHSSGLKASAICAGFLINGAEHNKQVRMLIAMGQLTDDVTSGGHELFESYRAMAEANGVAPDDPVLAPCRSPDE